MPHAHAHDPTTDPRRSATRLRWTLVLVVTYMLAEVAGGIASGSLALLADAGHMLSDAASLGLALFAIRIARREPTPERTWGFHRTEILAALANGVGLVVVALLVLREAWERFRDPPEVTGPLMMAVAAGGLVVNGIGLLLLHRDRGESLNLRGAWLHVMADAAGSGGALAAGLLVWWRGWQLADPIASALIGALILASSWTLLEESVAVLMEGTPAHIDLGAVRSAIRRCTGVRDVHDLHVWSISSGREALAVHVVTTADHPDARTLREVRDVVAERFGIRHATIQIEPHRDEACGGHD